MNREKIEELRERAKENNKPVFLKLYENTKAIALLMVFPDGNLRIRVASKLQFNKQYINFRESMEIKSVKEILMKLEEEKELLEELDNQSFF